jgi:hypothetical protein
LANFAPRETFDRSVLVTAGDRFGDADAQADQKAAEAPGPRRRDGDSQRVDAVNRGEESEAQKQTKHGAVNDPSEPVDLGRNPEVALRFNADEQFPEFVSVRVSAKTVR